jgi:hypothetical protein
VSLLETPKSTSGEYRGSATRIIFVFYKLNRNRMARFYPSFEQLQARTLQTLVFVFNGNALAKSSPDSAHTLLAAYQLLKNGDRAIQLSTPQMQSPRDFYALARVIQALAKGQPIGLIGFSAGGALAARLSGVPGLNVKAVLNFYGPPDLNDYLVYHNGDRFYRYVGSNINFNSSVIKLLSGPSSSTAYVVNAFGLHDRNVVASVSTASFNRDFEYGETFYYPGPHGVSLFADYPAFQAFVAHLPTS